MVKRTQLLILVFSFFISCLYTEAHAETLTLPEKAFRLTTEELILDAAGKVEEFPKYTTQLLNIANRNAQSTRPKYVGQMSDLIQEFDGETYEEWIRWYLHKNPESIDLATDRTFEMIENMRRAMAWIDREMVRRWIAELILAKSYAGLRCQKSILKRIAETEKSSWRLATPEEETKGIDGFIGTRAVSIMPVTYLNQPILQDDVAAEIIFYEKVRGGVDVFYKRQK